VETVIAGIWAELLGLDRVGRRDGFFELGGHSLLALRVAMLSQQAGMEITVADLFAHPTVAALAADVTAKRGRGADPEDGAILLRPGAAARPLFLVHDGDGHLLYAHALTPYLDEGIPVYGLPVDRAGVGHRRTVQEMAARMVRIIRETQPVGPYRLAGYCFGGTLAYEMAMQLRGEDDSVEFLGMFDTFYHDDFRNLEELSEESFLLHLLARAAEGDPAREEEFERRRPSLDAQDFETLVDACRELSLLPPELVEVDARSAVEVTREAFYADDQYFVQPIHMPVHLFVAQDDKQLDPHTPNGWAEVLPPESLRVIPVPGTHSSMFRAPHLESLGNAFSAALRATAADSGSGIRDNRPHTPLVALRPGSSGVVAPLFCVPAAGANVARFNDLAGSLGADRPVYGFQPRGLDNLQVPHTSIHAMVDCCLRAVRQEYPRGTVHMLGHSFGGWVAFEAACRLQAAGSTVGSVTVIDSEAPDPEGSPVKHYGRIDILSRWIEIFEMTLEQPFGVGVEDLEKQSSKAGQIALVHERLVHFGMLPRRSSPDFLQGPLNVFATALRTRYTPRGSYPGKVRLVLVDDAKLDEAANRSSKEKLVEGWRRWAPNLVVFDAPGTRMTTLETPHVDALAALLSGAFEDGDEGR
jgi:thioesterase domain-containing protein